jgi:hypothetical protein
MFSARPGRQNGAQPLVTPVSPGRHAELTAGETTVTNPIGAVTSAATDSVAIAHRRNAFVIVDS